MTKAEIREAMKAKRRGLTKETIDENSRRITELPFSTPEFKSAHTVMVYMSSFKEPSTDVILRRVLSEKHAVIPVSDTDTHTVTPSYISSEHDMLRGAYGIREPKVIVPAELSDIDMILDPGIAFDSRGARIGFGEGYYDRLLADFRGPKVGICHDFQLLPKIPSLPHDSRMDIIITEKRILNDF